MNVTRCKPPELFRQTTDGLKLRKPTRCVCWADWFQARCHQNLNWEKRTGKSLALTISKPTRQYQALWQSARLWNQFDKVAKSCNYNVTWFTCTKAMVKFFWVYKNNHRMNHFDTRICSISSSYICTVWKSHTVDCVLPHASRSRTPYLPSKLEAVLVHFSLVTNSRPFNLLCISKNYSTNQQRHKVMPILLINCEYVSCCYQANSNFF